MMLGIVPMMEIKDMMIMIDLLEDIIGNRIG